MFTIEFSIEKSSIIIQIDGNEPMKKAIDKFLLKTDLDESKTLFLYNAKLLNMNEKISSIANEFDRENKKMYIVATVIEPSDFRKDKKAIICPKCKEICFININNYRISLNNCINKHRIEDLMISEFYYSQKIDLKNIICDNCKIKDMTSSNNKEFYKCFMCNKNLCPQCKSQHDRSHKIIDYDDKDYKCSIHIQPFKSYCKNCNQNLCPSCKDEHNKHEIIEFNDIIPDENILEKNLKELKKKIDLLKKELKNLKDKLVYIINKMDLYYKINEQIINNFDDFEENRRNYQVLYNIKELNNTYLFKDIDEIISTDNFNVKIKNILNLFHKINDIHDEIIIIYDVDEKEEEMRIFSKIFVNKNKDICQMVIENKVYELKETFNIKDYKKKELEIKLKNIERCDYFCSMFDRSISLLSIPEFYKLNTININKMLEFLRKYYELFFKDNCPKWLANNFIHLLLRKKDSDIDYKKIEEVYDQLENKLYISVIMDIDKVIEKIIEVNCNVEEINKWVEEKMEE